jgi:lipopolysaccharide transport system permease protein
MVPSSLTAYFWPQQHWSLLRQLVRREIDSRFRQNLMGGLWLVITPLAMLLILTVVFRHIMGVRWPGLAHEEAHLAFALRLYAGLAVFQFFADCVNRAPHLVLMQPQLVKKVVFPLELLAWVNVGSALIGLGVSALLLVGGMLWAEGYIPWSAMSLPLVWLPMIPLLLGLGWLLSGMGTYVRDVGQILGPLMSALMFLTPIFFPIESLPADFRAWMAFNPLAEPITQTRRVLIDGLWPDWSAWGLHLAVSCAVAWLGALWFERVRKGFADVV